LGTAAGLTPALIALVTLGACCSTAAAATAGMSLVAQSSGASPAEALANAWYLGVFQLAVVYVALLAQEQLLTIYRFALDPFPSVEPSIRSERSEASRIGRDSVLRGTFRVILVAAGLTWSLSVLTLGFTTPWSRTALPVEIGGMLQRSIPGVLAVVAGLFPEQLVRLGSRSRWGAASVGLRGLFVVTGASLVAWIPPPWSGPGFCGLTNELLGFGGFAPAWGAVTPPAIGLAALCLRWSFQFLLLGSFAVAVGVSPRSAAPLLVRASRASALGPGTSAATIAAASPSETG